MSSTPVGIEDLVTDDQPAGRMYFPKLSLDGILVWLKRRDVQMGFLLVGLMLALFQEAAKLTIKLWIDPDSYYQHGPLVPLAMGYILYVNREKIEKHEIKQVWWLMPIFLFFCLFDVVASWAHFYTNLHTFIFYAAFLTLACALYGWRRFFAMLPAWGYLIVGLPVWNRIIDDNTNQLQILSTTGAYGILKITGFNPLRMSPTEIQLDNFPLSIAAACSGMKLTLAMIASIVFIMLIARLKWWGNLILLAIAFPLALAINSLRIALIGMIGDTMGKDAGFWMHDYGSYGTLILAFWIVYVLAKKLGWKV